MKKIILLVLLLFVCGCSKKITCTYKFEYEDVKINNKIIFNLKDNTYKQKDIMIFIDEESAVNYFNDIEDYIEQYNLVLEKNKIISELSGEIPSKETKKEIKERYESNDYKCK